MSVTILSSYYDKEVTIDRAEADILLAIYLDIAKKQTFEPEVTSADDLSDASSYDHVAYHVEEFGGEHPNFHHIQHLFEDEGDEGDED